MRATCWATGFFIAGGTFYVAAVESIFAAFVGAAAAIVYTLLVMLAADWLYRDSSTEDYTMHADLDLTPPTEVVPIDLTPVVAQDFFGNPILLTPVVAAADDDVLAVLLAPEIDEAGA